MLIHQLGRFYLAVEKSSCDICEIGIDNEPAEYVPVLNAGTDSDDFGRVSFDICPACLRMLADKVEAVANNYSPGRDVIRAGVTKMVSNKEVAGLIVVILASVGLILLTIMGIVELILFVGGNLGL